MKRAYVVLSTCVLILVLFVVYRGWLGFAPLSAGDWGFHFPEEVTNFFIWPTAWVFWLHWGLGGNGVFIAGLETFFLITARIFYTLTGLTWAWYERVVWFIPFLLIGTYSSLSLVRLVFPTIAVFWLLTPIIFLTNTYIVMVSGGGQMGVAMAYVLAPLVLTHYIRLYRVISLPENSERRLYRQCVLTGVVLALMILFDSRIVYVLILGILAYWSVVMVYEKTADRRHVYFLGIPFIIAGLLHAFWILPLVLFRVKPIESLGASYSSIASVKFFSFADFSHALTLLHPNWPENLFGKVYFLQPEFLLLPILAFASLLFVRINQELKSRINPNISFFVLLGLLGAFFSKGANPPFDEVYLWMFERVPGFNVFRDPTKFYLLIAIAYSVLIPVSLKHIQIFFRRLPLATLVISVLFLALWLSTIRQFVRGQLSGTFVVHTVPYDYEVLKDVINQPEYFRTLWIPHVQRYGLSTYMHPAVDLGSLLETGSPSAVLAWMDSPDTAKRLARWSVKYVILPYDSQGEIFIDDRKYSANVQKQFQAALDANLYLRKVPIVGMDNTISVYETPEYKDHLWLEGDSTTAKLSWRMTFPTTYTLTITGLQKPMKLIFSETYDPNWHLRLSGQKVVRSQPTADRLNSFPISIGDEATGTLEYTPQQYVWYGLILSAFALIVTVVAIIVL
ncbi:hypothetical protein A2973_00595 [Candidatus Gottesmanbacteria bacterium RIFCSPLOWO2_01_FULL_49_10]|uniref:Membrane protein 6-pyruvoyl-tetrahydropterin synthase-related domain-containing protein n=1 Tax=Candidatus Gottesmanbacteria bacterium RIFCSPLOWO2_01_FULL_49_10 TaxID=1798396 RepID=A0A1F6AWM9_9BACT|nr:MAG: hypothetical protein A2973_00595 [Candidatus Gottesmanbacteria bacterium RIFCSPLOWO2_01_FULL_49_10]